MSQPQRPSLKVLQRPRIQQHLNEARSAALTILNAPLGYGKSIAIAHSIAEATDTITYTAAPWHCGAFVAEFLATVARSRPDFGHATRAVLENAAPIAQIIDRCAADLRRSLHPCTLIIEDAHEIAADLVAAEFFRGLCVKLPSHIRCIVATRTFPEWLQNDVQASVTIAHIAAETLAFTPAEILAFAEQQGLELRGAELTALHAQTLGWPAAVSLALNNAVPGEYSATSVDIAARLYASLPAHIQEIVEARTVMPHASVAQNDVDLCRMAGVPLSKNAKSTEIHPLILRAAERALDGDPAKLQQIHRTAARRAAHADDMRLALYHAERADLEALLHLLTTHTDEIVNLGDPLRLRNLVARFTDSEAMFGQLSYLRILLDQQQGNDEILDSIREAISWAESRKNRDLEIALRSKLFEIRLARLEPALIEEIEVWRATSDQHIPPQQKIQVARIAGWAYAVHGQFKRALTEISPYRVVDNLTNHHRIFILRAYAQTALGDHFSAQRTLDASMQRFEAEYALNLQARTLIWYARLANLWGDPLSAYEAGLEARRQCEHLAIQTELGALYSALGFAASALGDATTTQSAAQATLQFSPSAWYAIDRQRLPAHANILTARAYFLRGSLRQALLVARQCASAQNTPSSQRLLAAAEATFYAEILGEPAPIEHAVSVDHVADLADAEDVRQANLLLDFLSGTETSDGPFKNTPYETFATSRTPLLSLAVVRQVFEKPGNGHSPLDAGLEALRTAMGERPSFTALLVVAWLKARYQQSSDNRLGAREKDLLAHFQSLYPTACAVFDVSPQQTPQTSAAEPIHSQFTPRETEILTLLAYGFSNREMAERLTLSPRTVETHVERVLGKLDVSTRSRAIAKAIRLQLVDLDAEPFFAEQQ